MSIINILQALIFVAISATFVLQCSKDRKVIKFCNITFAHVLPEN